MATSWSLNFKVSTPSQTPKSSPAPTSRSRGKSACRCPAGEYYQTDLVGCAVQTRGGKTIGIVEDWREYGGPPLLAVNANGREILIPFAKSICVEIDVASRKIIVDLPPGLEDL